MAPLLLVWSWVSDRDGDARGLKAFLYWQLQKYNTISWNLFLFYLSTPNTPFKRYLLPCPFEQLWQAPIWQIWLNQQSARCDESGCAVCKSHWSMGVFATRAALQEFPMLHHCTHLASRRPALSLTCCGFDEWGGKKKRTSLPPSPLREEAHYTENGVKIME